MATINFSKTNCGKVIFHDELFLTGGFVVQKGGHPLFVIILKLTLLGGATINGIKI